VKWNWYKNRPSNLIQEISYLAERVNNEIPKEFPAGTISHFTPATMMFLRQHPELRGRGGKVRKGYRAF
jgi:hypothetical protein